MSTINNVFRVNGLTLNLTDQCLLAIFAILQLKTEINVRVLAIKTLRELRHCQELGLYEAKQIVDYIADHGTIQPSGKVVINPPKRTVEYSQEVYF